MNIQRTLSIALCSSLVFLSACVTNTGVNFQPKPSALKLGQLKSSEYTQLFGKPNRKTNITNSDGKYEIVDYIFFQNSAGTVSRRIMELEFRNDVLNAFLFLSSFDTDKSNVNVQSIDQLRAGIGKLTNSDIIAALGQPHGKAIFPTTLVDFKDKFGKGVEVWAWHTEEQVKYTSARQGVLKATTVYVAFDAEGKVVDVQTIEKDARALRN